MTVSDRDRTARSRLVGVGMVKNEADVVETSIRHNLRFLDEMIVLDHDSTDATPTILSSLVDEGLPLKLTRFGWHWRELFRRIVAGDDITSKDLLMYTVNAYAMDRVYQAGDEDLFTLVEELIATPVELRYTTHVPIDPLRALANWTSLLIDELQRQPV